VSFSLAIVIHDLYLKRSALPEVWVYAVESDVLHITQAIPDYFTCFHLILDDRHRIELQWSPVLRGTSLKATDTISHNGASVYSRPLLLIDVRVIINADIFLLVGNFSDPWCHSNRVLHLGDTFFF
jgi:hypothetical protein